MAEIVATYPKFSIYTFIVDDEDFNELSKYKWRVSSDKKYAVRRYKDAGKIYEISMSRHLMGLKFGDKRVVDFKDRNTFNCQKSNLRICTRAQDKANRTPVENRSSKYLGVSIKQFYTKKIDGTLKEYTVWRATISKDKKAKVIGSFRTEIEAAIAYNEAAIKLHGEFANLNKF